MADLSWWLRRPAEAESNRTSGNSGARGAYWTNSNPGAQKLGEDRYGGSHGYPQPIIYSAPYNMAGGVSSMANPTNPVLVQAEFQTSIGPHRHLPHRHHHHHHHYATNTGKTLYPNTHVVTPNDTASSHGGGSLNHTYSSQTLVHAELANNKTSSTSLESTNPTNGPRTLNTLPITGFGNGVESQIESQSLATSNYVLRQDQSQTGSLLSTEQPVVGPGEFVEHPSDAPENSFQPHHWRPSGTFTAEHLPSTASTNVTAEALLAGSTTWSGGRPTPVISPSPMYTSYVPPGHQQNVIHSEVPISPLSQGRSTSLSSDVVPIAHGYQPVIYPSGKFPWGAPELPQNWDESNLMNGREKHSEDGYPRVVQLEEQPVEGSRTNLINQADNPTEHEVVGEVDSTHTQGQDDEYEAQADSTPLLVDHEEITFHDGHDSLTDIPPPPDSSQNQAQSEPLAPNGMAQPAKPPVLTAAELLHAVMDCQFWDLMLPGRRHGILHQRLQFMLSSIALEHTLAQQAGDTLLHYAKRCDETKFLTGDHRILYFVSTVYLSTKTIALGKDLPSSPSSAPTAVLKRHLANRYGTLRERWHQEGLKWLLLCGCGTPFMMLLCTLFNLGDVVVGVPLPEVKIFVHTIRAIETCDIEEKLLPPIIYLMQTYPLKLRFFFSNHILADPDVPCSDWDHYEALLKKYVGTYVSGLRSDLWTKLSHGGFGFQLAHARLPVHHGHLCAPLREDGTSSVLLVANTDINALSLSSTWALVASGSVTNVMTTVEKIRAAADEAKPILSGRAFLEALLNLRATLSSKLKVNLKYTYFPINLLYRNPLLILDINSRPMVLIVNDMPDGLKKALFDNIDALACEKVVRIKTHERMHTAYALDRDNLPLEPSFDFNPFSLPAEGPAEAYYKYKGLFEGLSSWYSEKREVFLKGSQESSGWPHFSTISVYCNCAMRLIAGNALVVISDAQLDVIIPEIGLCFGMANGEMLMLSSDVLSFVIQHFIGRFAAIVFNRRR